jgi:hypothetical protein
VSDAGNDLASGNSTWHFFPVLFAGTFSISRRVAGFSGLLCTGADPRFHRAYCRETNRTLRMFDVRNHALALAPLEAVAVS